MTRLLVSVRDVAEARHAARGGADLVDLKDPAHGALGGLPDATIRAVVAALRADRAPQPVSATIGDVPVDARTEILARVAAVAACGVDIVKVGITPGAAAFALLDDLARTGRRIAPVLIADDGIDGALVSHALARGFAALMLDTADKRAGSLLDRVPADALARFVARARAAGVPVGLAGALRLADVERIASLAPDFAGFRSAVCAGARSDALDPARLAVLAAALRRAASPGQCTPGSALPSSSARSRSISVR